MNRRISSALIFLAFSAPTAAAQYLLAVESTGDKVYQLNAFDGSVVDPSYIDLTVAGAQTPVEALVVGNEIWVSDQLSDKLMRFSLDGTTYLGDVSGGMDNIRGIALVNGEVWVSNAGITGGAPGDAIVRFSMAGAPLGSFPVGDPFDVVNFQGDVLTADIAGDNIQRYTSAGVFVATFHDSDGISGIDFPEQLWVRANGNVLAGGFSAPIGIYEYDATGAQINYYAVGTGLRGVAELGNGLLLFSDGAGFKSYDPATNTTVTIVPGVSGRFFTAFAGASPGTAFCDPGQAGVIACPCSNPPSGSARGCDNSDATGGASIAVSGQASLAADTLVFTTSNQTAFGSTVLMQGTVSSNPGVVFGQGVRCVDGTLTRLYVMSPGGTGGITAPGPGDPTVSAQSSSLGDPIGAGQQRFYMAYYRDPIVLGGCPSTDTFNGTNATAVTWQ